MNQHNMTIFWTSKPYYQSINSSTIINPTSVTNKSNGTSLNPNMATSHTGLDIFRLTLSGIIFLATLFGNFAAIFYIGKHKQLRSIKNYYYGYYLINLNIADLMVAIFCIPFTVVYYESKKWTFGSLFCKVMPTMQVMAVSASICTLAVITWERYRAIIHPLMPRSTMFGLRIKLLLIWIWALIVAAPSFYAYRYDKTLTIHQCQEIWPTVLHRKGYTVFIFLANYALPLGFIFVCYVLIVFKLKFGLTPYGERASKLLQNQFIKLMTMLITSFAICYLPGYVCFFILDFGVVANNSILTIVLNFSHVLAWINSCLNPFFYCALNGYLRNCKSSTDIPLETNPHTPVSSQRESFQKLVSREDENENVTNPKESNTKKAKHSISSGQSLESYM